MPFLVCPRKQGSRRKLGLCTRFPMPECLAGIVERAVERAVDMIEFASCSFRVYICR